MKNKKHRQIFWGSQKTACLVLSVAFIIILLLENVTALDENEDQSDDDSNLRPPLDLDESTENSRRLNLVKSVVVNVKRKESNQEDDETKTNQENVIEDIVWRESPIKIVDAPDLSQTVESKQLTPEEIEADKLYHSAMSILNKTRGDKERGYSLLTESAKRGHIDARIKLAWSQLLGQHPVELNIDKARETFEELSEQGLPDAQMGLGFMYASGIGVNVSQAKALLYYTFAALGGNSWAQMALGYRHLAGVNVPANCDLALEYYTKVAREVASTVTFSGIGAPHRIRLLDEVDNTGASGILDNDLIDYYQLLADKGDVQAQVGLGQLHYQGGRGIPLDHAKALQYFQQAANAGKSGILSKFAFDKIF